MLLDLQSCYLPEESLPYKSSTRENIVRGMERRKAEGMQPSSDAHIPKDERGKFDTTCVSVLQGVSVKCKYSHVFVISWICKLCSKVMQPFQCVAKLAIGTIGSCKKGSADHNNN